MPTFHLSESHREIVADLTGIMLFPHNVCMRKKLKHAFLMDYAKYCFETGRLENRNPDLYEAQLKGHIPFQQMVNKRAEEIGYDSTLAGAMCLLTIATDRKFASLNLSRRALDHAYKNKKPTSKRKLESLWKDYQSVAHFWAAYEFWKIYKNIPENGVWEDFPCHPSQVLGFLSIAEYLRRKGESFRSLRSKNNMYLLHKNRTWRVKPVSRIPRLTDKDLPLNSMHKFIEPLLKDRKRYGTKIRGRILRQ